jgi:hypothetical protein
MLRYLLLILLLAACTDGGIDVLVVVQETNVPDPPDPCDGRARRDVEITRTCDEVPVRVVICTDAPLCDAAVDAIVAEIESCAETRLSFEAEPAECPE